MTLQKLQLSDDELRATLSRARETAARPSDALAPDGEQKSYVRAAEELGVPREAVLQALQEREHLAAHAVSVGDTVFAPSLDGCCYPGEVLELQDHTVKTRFASGGEHTCARADVRPLALLPGRKLEADCKRWGWWGAIVSKFNPHTRKVTVVHDDWFGEKETLPLRRIRLPAGETTRGGSARKDQGRALLVRWVMVAGGAGVALGVLLDRVLTLALPFLR